MHSPVSTTPSLSPSQDSVQDTSPTRSLWIGNLDPTLSLSFLLQIFNPFGSIDSIRLLPEKECCFVNFDSVSDAVAARERMQGMKLGNCVVRIGFGKTEGDGHVVQPTKSLWVGNILPHLKPTDLERIFSVFGPVESARILVHKTCGFVNFVKLEDAIRARNDWNGQEVGGSVVKIGFAKVPCKVESPPIAHATAVGSRIAVTERAATALEAPNAKGI